MDWVLGKLVIEVDKLDGTCGVLKGCVRGEDVVLLKSVDWLVSGGVKIDWGFRVASNKIGLEEISCWEKI